jgi:hypothetical protein
LDRAAVVDETFEFDDFRNEAEVDHEVVFADGGLDFESDAGVAGFESRGCRRGDRETASAAAAAATQAEDAAAAKGAGGSDRVGKFRGFVFGG